jgi:hypothetical protein
MRIGPSSPHALRPIDPGYRARRDAQREEIVSPKPKAKIIEAEFSPAPLPYPPAFLAHLLGQVMMNAQTPASPYRPTRKPRLGLLADETA